MGNIKQLTRYTYDDTVDQLDYSYNGNQVTRITDAWGSRNAYDVKEYVDAADASVEFGYDANGNMVYDLDRGISAIRYNCLNLPDTIQFDNGSQIVYRYDAQGVKLSTRYVTSLFPMVVPIGSVADCFDNPDAPFYPSATSTTISYVGNVEYKSKSRP